jgi:hypothetical protein
MAADSGGRDPVSTRSTRVVVVLPAHDVDGPIVWGLTYRMLDSRFELLR